MTELEKEALILFKDYSHLQLKTVKVGMKMDKYEEERVDKALEYHQYYLKYKLNSPKNGKPDITKGE